eukprot:TRINITY_DN30971_c0_g2_i1.p1 TRINITY_DN30971_c0_g2~~TRINITY_DN30971_c0_g2_i1.p1  ORF type:complete len:468 (+),score=50.72 TRINITY_DN30971_c0_g2_i1:68-1471(+)
MDLEESRFTKSGNLVDTIDGNTDSDDPDNNDVVILTVNNNEDFGGRREQFRPTKPLNKSQLFCIECGTTFARRDGLIRHLRRTRHESENIDLPPRKSTPQIDPLSPNRKFQCDLCQTRFIRKDHLARHVRNVHKIYDEESVPIPSLLPERSNISRQPDKKTESVHNLRENKQSHSVVPSPSDETNCYECNDSIVPEHTCHQEFDICAICQDTFQNKDIYQNHLLEHIKKFCIPLANKRLGAGQMKRFEVAVRNLDLWEVQEYHPAFRHMLDEDNSADSDYEAEYDDCDLVADGNASANTTVGTESPLEKERYCGTAQINEVAVDVPSADTSTVVEELLLSDPEEEAKTSEHELDVKSCEKVSEGKTSGKEFEDKTSEKVSEDKARNNHNESLELNEDYSAYYSDSDSDDSEYTTDSSAFCCPIETCDAVITVDGFEDGAGDQHLKYRHGIDVEDAVALHYQWQKILL